MLWLYNEAGEQITANDDYFGLQSYIEIEVPAGRYRLRAGVCCGDPERWYSWSNYNIEFTATPVETTTSTTVPETTTTSSTTTSSTTTSTTTTVPETTTTTSTTVPETTTTVASTVPVPVTTSSTTSSTAVVPVTSTSTSTTSTTSTVPTVVTTSTVVPVATVPDVSVIDQMNEEQIVELVAELNTASDEVKKEFESTVDVFDGRFDDYVPSGSNVPVKTRRTLIAITAVLFVAPAAGYKKR